jgi:hypothetical protein
MAGPEACEVCSAKSPFGPSRPLRLFKYRSRWLCFKCFDREAKEVQAAKRPDDNSELPQPNVPPGNNPSLRQEAFQKLGKLLYEPPKLEKLSLEERLLEHAANWHMVKARLRLVETKLQEDPLLAHCPDKEIEAFYQFCVTLMKG